jgi:NAD(P)-dependent dehydrogenase (short-subunit alcohol dehydrogenase family)
MSRLAGRLAVITGASRGIGAAVARRFAAEGCQLVLVARTVGGLEAVDDDLRRMGAPPATLVPLDLPDFPRIDDLGRALFERFGRVDILVANAGVLGALGPVAQAELKVWERAFALNVMANYRLLRSFDLLLRRSDAGRVIVVTDKAARQTTPYWGAYAASKAALETIALTYAAEMKHTPVKINLLDPGVVGTALRAKAFPGEDPCHLPAPETVAEAFVELAEASCQRHGETISLSPSS